MLKIVIVGVLLVACGGNDDGDDLMPDASGSRCGDGICSSGETNGTCAADCAANACTEFPDNCTAETICVSGSCVAAFPRVYRLSTIHVMVPTTRMGNTWDAGGGAPDLFLGDANMVAYSPIVDDAFTANFTGPFTVQLIAGQAFRIDVWDEDISVHDYAMGCVANPITAAQLRTRTFNCSGASGTLTAVLQP